MTPLSQMVCPTKSLNQRESAAQFLARQINAKASCKFNTIVLRKTVVGRVPAEAGHDATVNGF